MLENRDTTGNLAGGIVGAVFGGHLTAPLETLAMIVGDIGILAAQSPLSTTTPTTSIDLNTGFVRLLPDSTQSTVPSSVPSTESDTPTTLQFVTPNLPDQRLLVGLIDDAFPTNDPAVSFSPTTPSLPPVPFLPNISAGFNAPVQSSNAIPPANVVGEDIFHAEQLFSAAQKEGDPTVTISAVSDDHITEGIVDGASFVVSRTGDASGVLSVPFTFSGEIRGNISYTATGNGRAMPGAFTFGEGESSLSVSLHANADSIAQGTEEAQLSLSPGTGMDDSVSESDEVVTVGITAGIQSTYQFGTPSIANVVIHDDDQTSGKSTISVSASAPNAAEPSSNGGFTITRTGDITDTLTVNIQMSGSASPGMDYEALSNSVIFMPNQMGVTGRPLTRRATTERHPGFRVGGRVDPLLPPCGMPGTPANCR